jgi:RNA polymerase sigma-70 factor, ECF subfamily
MSSSFLSSCDRAALQGRLIELWERTGDQSLRRLAAGQGPADGIEIHSEQGYLDWVSTSLMECYKRTGDAAVFALLFELNRAAFLQAIQSNLRRSYLHVDPQDVLQEVFLNIYRYPHRFHADRADAFRGWGHRIARNTLLKFLKGQSRIAQFHDLDDEAVLPADPRARTPDRAASEAESAGVVNCAYLLYLQLYLQHFGRLSPKERQALTMVEVDGISYRDAAAALGIRLENLKMVVFRGRRKIFRGMEQSLELLGKLRRSAVASATLACESEVAADATGRCTRLRAGGLRGAVYPERSGRPGQAGTDPGGDKRGRNPARTLVSADRKMLHGNRTKSAPRVTG